LNDRDASSKLPSGITNHHVLGNHLDGSRPFTTFDDPIKVELPSRQDRELYFEKLKTGTRNTRQLKDTVNGSRQSKGLSDSVTNSVSKAVNGSVDNLINSPVDRCKNQIEALEGELSKDNSFDLHGGTVFASPGFR
jgi:hypothetical protein